MQRGHQWRASSVGAVLGEGDHGDGRRLPAHVCDSRWEGLTVIEEAPDESGKVVAVHKP